MRMNEKAFKNHVTTPFREHDYNGIKIETHFLNENSFFLETVNKGKFYMWSSDGKDYKLFIEEGYYKIAEVLFQDKINEVWIDYFNDAENDRIKFNKKVMFPILLVYFAVFLGTSLLIQKFAPQFNIFAMAFIVVVGFIGAKKLGNKINLIYEKHRVVAEGKIRKILGKKEFKDVLKNIGKYREKFYQFEDDEETSSEDENSDQDLIENNENDDIIEEVKVDEDKIIEVNDDIINEEEEEDVVKE